ncbi:major facilitator transporter [Caballeronia fortuita]|uniref:Major facilitator transporter n=1 Tax=Caballeronia fortuita TaxID=1777138 RepID=A0A158EAJ8_9BURK|nr:MFS transporter [Caballeronia fortuita]SAL03750.1 major facilitator transporter [Caballeronia fortuita]
MDTPIEPIKRRPTSSTLRYQTFTLGCTLAIQAFATGATLAFPILASMMPGLRPAQVGVFLAVVYFGAMIGSVLGSGFVTGFGPVRASQGALVLQAAGLGLLALGEPNLRLVAALLCGFGYGPITPASSQILARTTPPERMGLAFSLKQTGVPLGGLLAGAALPLAASLMSWQAAFAALALSTLIVAVASGALRSLDDQASGHIAISSTWHRPIIEVLAHRGLRAMAVVSLLFSACQLSVSGYLMAYLHQQFGLGLAQSSVIYAVTQAAGIGGRLLWGHLADRTGSSRRVLIGVCVLMAVSAAAVGAWPVQWGVVALAIASAVLGATAIGWNGVFLGEVARLAPAGRVAAVTGGALFFTYFGVVIGPPCFGWAAEHLNSIGFAYCGLAIMPVIALVLLLRRF